MLDDSVFGASEQKLKMWARIQAVFFTVVAVALFFVIFTSLKGLGGLVLGLLVAFVIWFLSMISAWTLYAFADLVEYTKSTHEEVSQMSAGLAEYTRATNQTLNAMSGDLYLIAKHYSAERETAKTENAAEKTQKNDENEEN